MAAEIVESERNAYYRERISHNAKTGKSDEKKFSYDPLDAIKHHMGAKY